MTKRSKYTLILFYSHANAQSIKVRVSLNQFVSDNFDWVDVNIKEVDFEEDKEKARSFGVFGTPVTLIYKDGLLITRRFGEVSVAELASIIKHDK